MPVQFAKNIDLELPGDQLVCLTTRVTLPNLKGDRARSRFKWVLIDISHRLPDLRVVEVDLAHFPFGEGLLGVSLAKPIPVIVLILQGKEVARQTVLLRQAAAKDAVEHFTKWITGHLAP